MYTSHLVNENSPKVSQPNWNVRLFDHQLALVKQCLTIESGDVRGYKIIDNSGIICPKVGYGKSYVVLALCEHEARKHMKVWGGISKEVEDNGINLIIVPHGLVNQWEIYVKNTSLPYRIYKSKKDTRDISFAKTVVVSANALAPLVENLPEQTFARIFIDEADTIKIPQIKKITLRAKFTWLVTANKDHVKYMKNLSGSLTHIVQALDIPRELDLRRFPEYGHYRHELDVADVSDEFVEKSMNIPPMRVTNIECCQRISNLVKGVISDAILEKIESGDLISAMQMLGISSFGSEDSMVTALVKSYQDKIDAYKETIRTTNDRFVANELSRKISVLEGKINDIKKRILDQNTCPITLEEIETPVVVKCCMNKFSADGIIYYMNRNASAKCPYCRSELAMSNIVYCGESAPEKKIDEIDFKKLSKVEACYKILETMEEKKIIVFSHGDSFHIEGGKSLKGNMHVIAKTLNWFNEESDEKKILVLNSDHAAEGFNLQAAEAMILFSSYDEEKQNQMIGRANRFGRELPLNLIILN